jgi:dipeptidyl aminopeptidase/acylaminoacyl peptidase
MHIFSISQFLKFITAGFAIFLCDGRGSCNRGIQFESAIKFNMGSVEVDDQVHALKYAAEHFFPLLDLDRVGVTGWSYGKLTCVNCNNSTIFRRLYVTG